MSVGAAQVGFDHQLGDDLGIGGGKAGGFERALGEGDELCRGHARRVPAVTASR